VRAFAHVGKTDIVVIYTSNPEVRPFSRRVVSSTYTFINNVLFGLHVRYYNGLNIFRRDLLLKLPPIGNSFSYAAEILVSLLKSGATYIELPMELVPKKLANTSAFRWKNVKGVFMGISGLFWRIRVKNNIFSRSFKSFKSFSKKTIKFFIYNALSILPSSSGVVILMYHSVGENKEFFTVNNREFERQMKYLKDNDLKVIKLEDLINLKSIKELKKAVVITFDDGYRDNYINALPILKKYDFPATIFVSTALIGSKKTAREGTEMEILSIGEIKEMQKGGLIDFGSHCHSHPKLTSLENGQIEKEFTASRKILSDILRHSPCALAYPYGNYDGRVSNIAKKFFDITVTVKKGKEKGIDQLDLRRNSIDSKTNFWEFKKIAKLGRL